MVVLCVVLCFILASALMVWVSGKLGGSKRVVQARTNAKKVGVSAEVHLYATGGHGYGMRHVDGQPVTDWPKPCEAWLKTMSIIK